MPSFVPKSNRARFKNLLVALKASETSDILQRKSKAVNFEKFSNSGKQVVKQIHCSLYLDMLTVIDFGELNFTTEKIGS